jgi:hypothetical protein
MTCIVSDLVTVFSCRSELAREEPVGNAFIQNARVIVNDHREQARSYRIPESQNSGIAYI